MGVDLLLGLQWGDEGKGKIVDVLTKNYDIIARFITCCSISTVVWQCTTIIYQSPQYHH